MSTSNTNYDNKEQIKINNNEESDNTRIEDNKYKFWNIKNFIDNEFEGLFKKRNSNWQTRNKVFQEQSENDEDSSFTNVDRIALFQFNIDDSSYGHPKSEKCRGEKGNYSPVEFRRRKLLLPVLDACEKFGVEILVLPEYSVRPETVRWLYNKIKGDDDNIKGYSFSVWAGTFKITPGYSFNNLNIKDDIKIGENNINLGDSSHTCSAVFPIILNKANSNKVFGDVSDLQEVQILTERFKKYPSIALDEVINTIPAKDDMFIPMMKKIFKRTLFGDARDDVTELICAELFLMASPSNFISFGKRSYDMFCKFEKGKTDFNWYIESVIKDFKTFGEYISFYQTKKKYNRTPIILVPACTTRATDYYINAQANYLASGITTVLCNSAGNSAKGGSCFIGQNSWDNYKLNKKNQYIKKEEVDYVPKNTIYHGLQPGIYQQSCNDENRGALGSNEQALLICDINPDITFKGNPNPESIMDSLSIVAHIPIIEEDVFSDKCKSCSRKCFNKESKNLAIFHRDSFKYLKDLDKHIEKNNFIDTTIYDEVPSEIEEILSKLSEVANSKWLKKRGEIYLKQHKNIPMGWPAPAFLDWLYVVVDYHEFFYDIESIKKGINNDTNKDYEIQMPAFSNDSSVK